MPLLRLICELAVLTGKMEHSLSESDVFPSLRSLIANVHVYPDFAVIERGEADHGAMGQFGWDRYFPRRPARSLKGIVRRMLRHSRV